MEFESEKNTISLKYDKDYSEPIFVNADQERILQVLTNLVVNSLKYGTENGFTKVSVEEYNNDKILVKVSDNGTRFSSSFPSSVIILTILFSLLKIINNVINLNNII